MTNCVLTHSLSVLVNQKVLYANFRRKKICYLLVSLYREKLCPQSGIHCLQPQSIHSRPWATFFSIWISQSVNNTYILNHCIVCMALHRRIFAVGRSVKEWVLVLSSSEFSCIVLEFVRGTALKKQMTFIHLVATIPRARKILCPVARGNQTFGWGKYKFVSACPSGNCFGT